MSVFKVGIVMPTYNFSTEVSFKILAILRFAQNDELFVMLSISETLHQPCSFFA